MYTTYIMYSKSFHIILFPACAVGFYMEDKTCTKCPVNSNTASNASTSVVQCLCDVEKGFVGPPGGPCEEVFCTELKAPENGGITKCGNKVGDVCDFSCEDGYVIERGSTKRTCQNTGDWDGTPPFCVRKYHILCPWVLQLLLCGCPEL